MVKNIKRYSFSSTYRSSYETNQAVGNGNIELINHIWDPLNSGANLDSNIYFTHEFTISGVIGVMQIFYLKGVRWSKFAIFPRIQKFNLTWR